MEIKINKADINEHLWLQRLVEACLHRETLRWAIQSGHVPTDTKELWFFEVTMMDRWGPIVAAVTYSVATDEPRPDHIKHYHIEYTLADVASIAMREAAMGKE